MIKIIDQDQNELGPLLSSKHIPHKDEILLQDNKYYRVFGVIYDDDEGDVLIFVRFLGIKNTDVRFLVELDMGTSIQDEHDMALSILKKVIREKRP